LERTTPGATARRRPYGRRIAHAAFTLDQRYLDQGFSTAADGDIGVDLLFVAAGKSFEELRSHLRTVDVGGIAVSALDIDGMLATKQTNRDADISDRQRLQRLKAALDRSAKKPRPG